MREAVMQGKALFGAIAAATVVLIAAPTASAERAIALSFNSSGTSGSLAEFDTETPSFFEELPPVSGLGSGEELRSIAYRPSNGRLYGLTQASGPGGTTTRTYTIDPDSAVATLVGPPAGITLSFIAMDFDPVADVIRVGGGENARIDPDTGARLDVPDDTDLPLDTRIGGIAYDRSTSPPPGATTLYAINSAPQGGDPTVGTIGGIDGSPSPNLGTYTPIAKLGVPSTNLWSVFDISPQTGTGYATLSDGSTELFYKIALSGTEPAATLVGEADFSKDFVVTGLAILPGEGPKPPISCQGKTVTIPGTDSADSLKGTNGRDVIAGLGGNDKIVGRNGNDIVCGGDGNDNINGNAGKDKLYGDAGKDKLNGSGGKGDFCSGGAGKDKSTGSCEKARSA
jgi:hypothetical protein